MKKTSQFIIFIFVWIGIACKGDNEKLLSSIIGTWQVNKIVFYNNNSPDSTVNCPTCVLQLDNCTLGTGVGIAGCYGFYKLNNGQKVNIVYTPDSRNQGITFSIVTDPQNPPIQLMGLYKINSLSKSSMVLEGQLIYKNNGSVVLPNALLYLAR